MSILTASVNVILTKVSYPEVLVIVWNSELAWKRKWDSRFLLLKSMLHSPCNSLFFFCLNSFLWQYKFDRKSGAIVQPWTTYRWSLMEVLYWAMVMWLDFIHTKTRTEYFFTHNLRKNFVKESGNTVGISSISALKKVARSISVGKEFNLNREFNCIQRQTSQRQTNKAVRLGISLIFKPHLGLALGTKCRTAPTTEPRSGCF